MVRRIVPYLIGICMITIISLMVVPYAIAQSGAGSTSVYKTLYTGKTTAGPSVVVPNIGQVGNQVFVRARNAPGKTCQVSTTLQLNATLQFTYDNVNWSDFGSPTGGVDQNISSTVQGQIYFGVGLFPAVRFMVNGFDNVNCVLDAYYTGSSNSTQLASSTIFTRNIINTQVDALGNILLKRTPITITGWSANGGEALPFTGCEGYFSGTSPAAGSIRISDGAAQSSEYICYMLVTTASTAATFQIVTGTGATCGTGTTNLTPPLNLTSNAPLSLGNPIGIIIDARSPNPVCAVVTGGPVSMLIGLGQH